MIEKYTFDLEGPRLKRKKLILVKTDSETRFHIILKVLGYILFYDPRLRVEVPVGMTYKPDLVIEDETGKPELWIDCGYVPVKKASSLPKKLKNTRIVLIKKTRREMENFRNLLKDRVEGHLEFLAFDPGFVEEAAEALRRINLVTLYEVMENVIGVTLNDRVLETTLYHETL